MTASIIEGLKGSKAAAEAIAAGQIVGMPTETVYGLAGDASNPEAVARIFAAKGRPAFNPLIAHVESLEKADREGVLDPRAIALASAYWPGPLTLVVPVKSSGSVCELARAGLDTIGLRVPAHAVALTLLHEHGGPLAAPSANPSGRLSPTTAADVANAFDDEIELVLDGGPCEAGIESTIVAVLPNEPPRLLRPGAISRERIVELVGELADAESDSITAPGQLSSHYAPAAGIRLNVGQADEGEVLLAFGASAPAGTMNLSESGDLVEAAANLYRMLRDLDRMEAETIAVMPIPDTGLGEAINDRLRRAAAPRN